MREREWLMEAEFEVSCGGMEGGGRGGTVTMFFHTWTTWEDAEFDWIALKRYSL